MAAKFMCKKNIIEPNKVFAMRCSNGEIYYFLWKNTAFINYSHLAMVNASGNEIIKTSAEIAHSPEEALTIARQMLSEDAEIA